MSAAIPTLVLAGDSPAVDHRGSVAEVASFLSRTLPSDATGNRHRVVSLLNVEVVMCVQYFKLYLEVRMSLFRVTCILMVGGRENVSSY